MQSHRSRRARPRAVWALALALSGGALAGGCSGSSRSAEEARAEVARSLDALHAAAAAADARRYFGAFTTDAVFLGTAPGERWTMDEFRAYAEPHFARGQGWTYVPRPGGRHVALSEDGSIAWFDEVLDSAKYGECRGTGVLRREPDGAWRVVHYNLMIPIPNELVEMGTFP